MGVVICCFNGVYCLSYRQASLKNEIWNALFWIVQLFVSVNAVAKSFLQDSKGRMLYYYTISGAGNYIHCQNDF